LSIEFLENNFDKVSYLVNLLTSRATGLSADNNEYEILRRELLSDNELLPLLPSWLKQHRNLDTFWGFIQPKFSTYAERRTYISEQFTPVLDLLEFGASPQIPNQKNFHTSSQPQPVARNKRKVFIVHAIILHEQASSGMTIIEKIEHYSNEADFAIVLYTACDHGRGVHETKIPPKNRARQNVVFEHGYLMAKLGRENVCSLVKGNIETPNDISGVVYVGLDDFGAWKTEIAKELKACGYQLDPIF
jgi:hypothetical protein